MAAGMHGEQMDGTINLAQPPLHLAEKGNMPRDWIADLIDVGPQLLEDISQTRQNH